MSARLSLSLAGAALTALLAVPAAAVGDDAAYTVYSCRGPEGTPVSTRAWQADAGDAGIGDACASGGALSAEVDGPALGPGRLSGLRFAAPPGAVIAGYRIHLTAATADGAGPGQLQAGLAAGSLLEPPPVTQGCPDTDCTFGDAGEPLDGANLVTDGGLPVDGLALVARCSAGACHHEEDGPPAARARLWRSAVDLVDPAPPVIGPAAGSLTESGAVSGRAALRVAVSDAGGGVASVVLRIDGAERARLDAGGDCAEPYVVAAPCPASLPASLEVDTRTLADGPHVAEVRATDAAGRTTSSAPLAFTVANAAPAAGPAAVVLAEPARAVIALDRTRFTLRARGDRITGVVRREDGAPAAGAQLVVRARRFGADAPRPAFERTLRADGAGRFAVPLGVLPRRLSLLLDDPRYRTAESDEVQIRGDLTVTLTPPRPGLRNGATMTLDGRVRGAGPGAAIGRPVLVQAFVGGRWATVDSVEADALGRARWRYRFRNTTRPTRYRFRMLVPRGGADWPWPATASPPLGVLVRP